MNDQLLNDRLITFIERNALRTIINDVIFAQFQRMDDNYYFCKFNC
jgi:hypothetical protein